jgi:predicted site-specific integrase-resolvase
MADDGQVRSHLRCAIYTRKSTEEGLEQQFNSLDAQREAAMAYVQSQRHLGWAVVETRFDDGGFSGGNMERPALQKLLTEIEAGNVDCVLVYKVDRLSRSLLDFARLMDRFDQRSVSFVSVTQQFNTTSSLGRLTLNIKSWTTALSCGRVSTLRGRPGRIRFEQSCQSLGCSPHHRITFLMNAIFLPFSAQESFDFAITT